MNRSVSANKLGQLVLMTSCLLLSVINPASAAEALHCEAIGANLPAAERNAQIQECLARASLPANVKEVALKHKRLSCLQNAKNKALKGAMKEIYVETCINKNEAQESFEALAGM